MAAGSNPEPDAPGSALLGSSPIVIRCRWSCLRIAATRFVVHARAMAVLRDACMSQKNLMPFVLDAVRAEATLGEICDIFREAYGVYREPAVF